MHSHNICAAQELLHTKEPHGHPEMIALKHETFYSLSNSQDSPTIGMQQVEENKLAEGANARAHQPHPCVVLNNTCNEGQEKERRRSKEKRRRRGVEQRRREDEKENEKEIDGCVEKEAKNNG